MIPVRRSFRFRTLVVLCGSLGIALAATPPARAQWKAVADFSSCPSQYVPQSHGEEHGFATQQQCLARVSQAQASLACGRYQCLAEGSGQTGDAGGGDLVNQSTQALVKGFMNNNPQEMSLGMLGLGMNSLMQSMQPDPNADAQRAQIAAQQRQAAAAEAQRRAAEAARQAAEIKSQLLPGVGGADPAPVAPIVTASNDIKLLTSDELLGGTGTKFFGSGGNGCAPSQDASVVDLCGLGDPNAGKTNLAALPTDPNAGQPQPSLLVPNDYPGAPVINGLIATADGLNWDPEKKKRLATSLTSLDLPKDFVPPPGDADDTWAAVKARGADLELARQASLAPGPELFSVGAGQQKNGTDCTIFALANAASLPYGVVAARAGELLRQASWRSADDRAHPERAIYERGGLNGGEVIFLAEAFGQARVVTPGDFAKTVQGGQPVMFNKDGHEMVLAKTFQHDGQTWYEVMDSNQGPIKRLYMSAPELNTVISENGVAYSANPGTTATLLR